MRPGSSLICPPIVVGFFFGCLACRILVSPRGIKPTSPAVEVQSLNHWTTREVPSYSFNLKSLLLSVFFFILIFNWSIIGLQHSIKFLLYNNVNQLYAYIYPLPHEPPSRSPIPPSLFFFLFFFPTQS